MFGVESPKGGKNKPIEISGQQADLHKGIKHEVNVDVITQLNRAADQLNPRELELLYKFDQMKKDGKWDNN